MIREALDQAKHISEKAVISYLDDDGYPFSFTADVRIEEDGKVQLVGPNGLLSRIRGEVSVLKSHITPLPTGGYTDRKYVLFQGKVNHENNRYYFIPEKSFTWDEKRVPFPQYCEIAVPQARRYMKELTKKSGTNFRPWLPLLSKVLRVTRLPFLVASLIPVALGTLVAVRHGFLDPFLFVLTILGISLSHLALNTANDYFDSKLGADWKNTKPTPFSGGSRSIQYGLVSSSSLALFSALSFLFAAGIGAYLALLRGPFPILGFMAAGFFLAVFYTSPPFKLAYKGFGELAVGVGFGPILVNGSYYIQAQRFSMEPLLLSIPIGIFVSLILFVNEIPDIESDREAGKQTIATRLSKDKVVKGYLLLISTAMAIIVLSVIFGLLPILSIFSLLVTLPAYSVYKMIGQYYGDQYMMIPAMAKNIKAFIYLGVILIASYLFSFYFHL
jgi:1,4-dihydroxy-2-naphthoate octaprenyltransferase